MNKLSPVVDTTQDLSDAFPDIDPGIVPLGSRVLVQIRTPKQRVGSILLTRETTETEKWNTQIAKVVGLGPVAFSDRKTLQKWPEGSWCATGDYVRVPKYGGDRWEIVYGPNDEDKALFALFDDLNILGRVTVDPRAIRAFI